MAVRNCNGTLWSDPRGFHETYADMDLIFYTQTNESHERGLPILTGYTWESGHRKEIKGKYLYSRL